MTSPDEYAASLTPAPEPDTDSSGLPAHDPGTDGVDPDTQGGGDH